MPSQSHRSDPRILNRRTLARDHRRLAALLSPGLHVLDAGCGTGSITAGIARAVAPGGTVLGIDRDESLLQIARAGHPGMDNLRFESADLTDLPYAGQFDIVSAARVLQWIPDPALALAQLVRAAKPGGLVVVLDYNHTVNPFSPPPPQAFQSFYDAFLNWRAANRWDNEMASHLPALFSSAGLENIEVTVEDEIFESASPGFEDAIALFPHIIESLGPKIAAAGHISDAHLAHARQSLLSWAPGNLQTQTLTLRAVSGKVPDSPAQR